MPHFLVQAFDKPGHLAVRMENRPAHLEWARQHAARIRVGGPLLSAPDGEPIGSSFIIEGESLAEIRALFDSDPYVLAGLFQRMDINVYKPLIGEWVPS